MLLEFWEEVFDECCVREDEVDLFGVLLLAETLDEELLRLLPVFAVLAVRLLLLPLFTVFPWRLALGAEASLVAGVSFSLGMLAVSVAMVLLLLLSSVTLGRGMDCSNPSYSHKNPAGTAQRQYQRDYYNEKTVLLFYKLAG